MIALARDHVEPFTGKQIDLVTGLRRPGRDRDRECPAGPGAAGAIRRAGHLRRGAQGAGETGQAVSGTLDLTRVLDLISASAMALGQSDACALFRYDRTNRRFILWRATGLEEALSAQIRSLQILEAETVMGTAIRQHAPVSVADLSRLPSWPLRDVALGAGIRSVLIVPLVRRGAHLRNTCSHAARGGESSPSGPSTCMQTFANQSVLAIQNARLFREIEEKSRQLEIASQHKSQFLANMSHELRTPLNAVLGYTEMLLDGVYGEVAGEAHEILEYVQSNGEHLLGAHQRRS